jgi:hypothetical protein
VTINEALQLITAIAAAVAGIGSVLNNIKIARAETKIDATHSKIAELETNTNGIKDALITSARKEGFQAGQIDQASQANPGAIRPE